MTDSSYRESTVLKSRSKWSCNLQNKLTCPICLTQSTRLVSVLGRLLSEISATDGTLDQSLSLRTAERYLKGIDDTLLRLSSCSVRDSSVLFTIFVPSYGGFFRQFLTPINQFFHRYICRLRDNLINLLPDNCVSLTIFF